MKIFNKTFWLSSLITLIYLLVGLGFLFMELVNMSWVLFVLLPVLIGVAIAMLPSDKKSILWGSILTTLVVLIALIYPGLSGLLCVVMALPLIAILILVGYFLTRLFMPKNKATNKLNILLLPLIPFLIASPIERRIQGSPEKIVSVKTTKIFDYSPNEVYDAIKSVDTLDAAKPFLMHFDLPIPTKCILEKEEVGGLRTCHFEAGKSSQRDFGAGTIVERITEIERGKVLKMDVIDYKLVGRTWLGFKEAIYYFEPVANGKCKITRITTYTSKLNPRIYWEPLEKIGIQQEHEYVLNNLEKDLKTKNQTL